MYLRVLGTLELAGEGVSGAPLGSAKLRRLLAALLVRTNAVVSVDRLADILWGDAPPTNVDAALHSLVSRLRAALRSAGTSAGGDSPAGVALLTRAPGYLLRADRDHVDAARFEDLCVAARAHLNERPARALGLLEEALSLWRGPAYAEFADEEFARAEAARLEELRATATEDWIEAALAVERHDEAVARAEALVVEHPLRERPNAQLMVALSRAGRLSDALTVYRTYRNRLGEELGLEPSEALQLLESEVLRQEPGLSWKPPAAAPAPPRAAPAAAERSETPERPPGNLPPAGPELVGRSEDLAGVTGALTAGRLVTLTGVGGVGKTLLALHAGAAVRDRYPDGVWLCELAAVHDPAAVEEAVTTVLEVQQRMGLTVVERLVEYLRPKQLLLVIDNCEHVVDAAAALAGRILRGCPQVTVLATSRQPLGVNGEEVRLVAPLPLPPIAGEPQAVARAPAARLFLERARAASSEFRLTSGNAAAVAALCRRLDGLPLALELAATRVRAMTPAEITERLDDRFRFLGSNRRMAAERGRTLRQVVDWSYELLDEEQRRIFDRLSIFTGSFRLEAAEAVVSWEHPGETDVAEALADLVDKSMVVAAMDADTTRYALLDTLRAYGHERLAARRETTALRRAHAAHYLAVAQREAARSWAGAHTAAAAAIAQELDELRAAHEWAVAHDPDVAIDLVAALVDYVELRMPAEVFAWAERTLDRAQAAARAHPRLPLVYAVAASGARFRGDLDGAADLAERGVAAAPPADHSLRFPLYLLTEVRLFQGRLDDCERLGHQLARLSQAAGDQLRHCWAGLIPGLARAYRGETDEAVASVDDIRRVAEAGTDPLAAAWACYAAGEVRLERDPEAAAALLDEAVVRARLLGDRYLTGVALVSAASVRSRHGDPQAALALFRDVIEHWHAAGNWTQQWTTVRNVVDVLARSGQDEAAAVLHGAVTNRTTAPVFGADADRLDAVRRAVSGRLGQRRFAAASARGAALREEEVVAFACAALAGAEAPATRDGPPAPTGVAPTRRADEAGGLIGRDYERAMLQRLLAPGRIVTLTGAGGIGKSTLARAAVALPGGRVDPLLGLCDLATARDASDAGRVVAEALGFPSLDAAFLALADARGPVVLDNCEHLLDQAAELARRLVEECPGVSVLATSRAPLDVAEELLVPVEGLSLPASHGEDDVAASAAVELFAVRARAAGAGIRLDGDDAAVIAELCRRLDGLPLAIELAAARTRSLTPSEILDTLDERLDVLTRRRTHGDPRHASLETAIAWSSERLPAATRAFFERLAVFTGSFTAEAAQWVAAEPGDDLPRALDHLDQLVAQSLVTVHQEAGRSWYRMLGTLRAYGRARLSERGQLEAVQDRWVDSLVWVAGDVVRRGLRSWPLDVWVTVQRVQGDLHEALRWCLDHDDQPDRAIPLFTPLWCVAHNAPAEPVAELGDRLLARWPARDHRNWGDAAATAATANVVLGALDRGGALAEQALAAPRSAPAAAIARRALYLRERAAGRDEDALAWAEAGIAGAQADDIPPWRVDLETFRAIVLAALGRTDEAIVQCSAAYRAAAAQDSPDLLAWVAMAHGCLEALRDRPRGRALLERVAQQCRDASFPFGIGASARALGAIALLSGDVAEAATRLRQALDLFVGIGYEAEVRSTLGWVAALVGAMGRAEAAAALRGSAGSPRIVFNDVLERAHLDRLLAEVADDGPPLTLRAAVRTARRELAVIAAAA